MELIAVGASSAQVTVAPVAIKMTFRSSLGDGTRVYAINAPVGSKIVDVKQMLCSPPCSMCIDASMIVLVLKGKGTAVARAHDICCVFLVGYASQAFVIRPHPA